MTPPPGPSGSAGIAAWWRSIARIVAARLSAGSPRSSTSGRRGRRRGCRSRGGRGRGPRGGPAASPRRPGTRREPPQQRRRRAGADRLPDGRQRGLERRGRPAAGGRQDREVGRLVEDAQGEELAGQRLAALRRSLGVQGGDDAAGRRRRQRSIGGDVGVEVEPLEGLAEERDPVHPGECGTPRRRPRHARRQPAATASARRPR